MDCPPKSVFPDTCAKLAKVAQVAQTMGEQGEKARPKAIETIEAIAKKRERANTLSHPKIKKHGVHSHEHFLPS